MPARKVKTFKKELGHRMHRDHRTHRRKTTKRQLAIRRDFFKRREEEILEDENRHVQFFLNDLTQV